MIDNNNENNKKKLSNIFKMDLSQKRESIISQRSREFPIKSKAISMLNGPKENNKYKY